MTIHDAVGHLGTCLEEDASGRYLFVCKKAFVLVKLYGKPARFRFAARDQLAFRLSGQFLTIEKQTTGAIQRSFAWNEIECICAGEPEKDDGSLFQG